MPGRGRTRLTIAVCAAGLAVTPVALGQSAADECAAVNGVRYDAPSDASTAQYVGVAGACRAAGETDSDIQVVPIGGRRGGGGGGGSTTGTSGTGGASTAPSGTPAARPPTPLPATSPGAGSAPTRTSPATPEPAPPRRTRRGGTTTAGQEAGAEVRVAQALSATDDEAPSLLSASSLTAPQVAIPVLAAIGLIGAAFGLRRRLS